MKHDPVRTNFLESTGAYLWQIAAWLVGDHMPGDGPEELGRASPPVLDNAFKVWSAQVSLSSVVQWSADTHIVPSTRTPLLSCRGSTVAIAVNAVARSVVEVSTEAALMLQSPTQIADLSGRICREDETSVAEVVTSLVRHGLLEMAHHAESALWGVRLEPFVKFTRGEGDDFLLLTYLPVVFFASIR